MSDLQNISGNSTTCLNLLQVCKNGIEENRLYQRGKLDFTEIVKEVLETYTDAKGIVSIACSVWFVRNAVIHKQKSYNVDGIIRRRLRTMEAYGEPKSETPSVAPTRVDLPDAKRV